MSITVEDEVSYHTAYGLLEAGSKVKYNGYNCFIKNGVICRDSGDDESYTLPYYSTFHHVYEVVDNFKPLGLHKDIVQVEVHGVTVYQFKGITVEYHVDKDGYLRDENYDVISKISYEGDVNNSLISVTVDSEGNVSKKSFIEMWSNEYD